jgi:hypothetical protein
MIIKRTILALLVSFILSSISYNLSAQVPQADSLALVALYDSTDGDNWTYKTNWKTGSDVGTWYGITVSGGRVTSVSLSTNNLIGTIPVEIGNLTMLDSLDLGFNQLSGLIPSEIGNLTNLTYLSLGANSLIDSIPPEIGYLIKLTDLSLWGNDLTGSIPPEIGNLVNLTGLTFSSNDLSGSLPDEIGNLDSLQNLNIAGNGLTGAITDSIGNLKKLNGIYLQSNNFEGSIPESIGNLTDLRYLYLYGNQLTGEIPDALGNLIYLRQLQIHRNQLTGVVPAALGNLSELVELYVNDNHLYGLPDLSSLTNLQWFYTENNVFTFEDIEPNMGVATVAFTYSPQDSVGSGMDTTLSLEENLELSVTVGGLANQYQWTLDGDDIIDATDSVYAIVSAQTDDAGSYVCKITNTIAPELTLYSRAVNVSVDDPNGISDIVLKIPKEYQLSQNFPNPFNPVTSINFALPEKANVMIDIFNTLGQRVIRLLNEEKLAGFHRILFHGSNFPSGVYLYVINANDFYQVKKMLLVK